MNNFKFKRSDFGPLPVALEHMDIFLAFDNGKVHGTNTLRLTARQDLTTLKLDAQDLEIHNVRLATHTPEKWHDVEHDYSPNQNSLTIKFPSTIPAGATFFIRTGTTCTPSDNILDGIYTDTTPPGAPQQYMSQCQQWGFQRILPVLDDCTAKCTVTTTIEADARYTHLISNGNISKQTNPDGKPVPKLGDPTRQQITFENTVPMAPYLFIVCVGTWDVLSDEITYESGKKVKLEYLVPPGKLAGAKIPMEILKDSILWHGRTQDYEYRYDVYRTICMEKSNFGGMENVGNTTIVTSAALIDEWTGDARLEYAHGVIIHEFEHNQCGSDVTMETPFDMWLNEAFTVDVERQYTMNRFDPDCTRLDQVDSMRAPIGGPLAIEDGGHLGNIVRDGFNNPDELVDGVTYVKAAEVIRMLRAIIGSEKFKAAKNTYFQRFNGSNANTENFFNCFQEASGRDLSQFKKEWLFTIGYPKVTAKYSYNKEARELRIKLTQTRSGKGGCFHVPVQLCAVEHNGNDISGTDQVVELTGPEHEVTLKNITEPAFISFNRNCSFYGTFTDNSATVTQLISQAQKDPNKFNCVEAMRRLTDIERIKLLKDINAPISDTWLQLYRTLLNDKDITPGLKSYLIRIDEQSLDRSYMPCYRERYTARARLLQTVATAFMDDLVRTFNNIDTYTRSNNPVDGMEERQLKATLLRTIIQADTPQAHKLAEEHFMKAWNISDRVSALACINLSTHPQRTTILNNAFEQWKNHLNSYTSYLAIIAGGIHDGVFDDIAAEEKRPEFKLEHPSHNRALYMPMSANNKMLWTEKGLSWLTGNVIKLAAINENSAIRMAACLQQVNNLADDLKPRVIAALEEMHKNIDPEKYPSASGRIAAYLGK